MEDSSSEEPCKSPSLLSSLRQFRYTGQQPDKPTTTKAVKRPARSESPLKLNTDIFKRLHEGSSPERTFPPFKVERFAYYNGKPEKMDEAQKFLKKIYPLMKDKDIYDALIQSDYNVDGAVRKLNQVIINKIDHTRRHPVATVATMTSTGVSTDKTWKRNRNDSPQCKLGNVGSAPAVKAAPPKPAYSVQKKESHEFLIHYNPRAKRQSVVDFLQRATVEELATVNFMSYKMAETIVKKRPYPDWKTYVEKIEGGDEHQAELMYDRFEEGVRVQSEMAALMRSCRELSQSLDYKVRQMTSQGKSSELMLQPSILSPELKLADYQMVGLTWLRLLFKQGVNGILADEMGLGKTIQVIAFLAYLKEQGFRKGVHLIVVPSSTLENWETEFKRWCPSLQVKSYYGSQEERKEIRMWWKNDKNKTKVAHIDILLTTYNLVNSTKDDKGFFRKLQLQYIVYDEAHMLKNMVTQRYMSLMRLQGQYRILLTGTPLQNNLVELMSLLIFVMPKLFAEKQNELKSLFKTTKDAKRLQSSFEKKKIRQAKQMMEPFVLRRLKQDVLAYLPPKTELVEFCDMTCKQRKFYHALLQEYRDVESTEMLYYPDPIGPSPAPSPPPSDAEEEEEELPPTVIERPGEGLTGSMAKMMLMRQAANHPAMLRRHFTDDIIKAMALKLKRDRTYRENNLENIEILLHNMSDHQLNKLCLAHTCVYRHSITFDYILDSGKINKLDDILPQLKEDGHRVLIFSQFRQAIDVLDDYMRIRQHTWLKLDGTTPVAVRQKLIDKFNSDTSIFAFLLTTKAGGCGINLAGADTVIIFDIDLNPYNDKQAEDRCHRMGQTKPVTVYRFITKDTIEETMLEIATGKLTLEHQITQGIDSKEHPKLLNLLKGAIDTLHPTY